MERTLFSFIWKYSRRDQLLLLLVTLTLFPLLFLTLELPKRIINDAIGAGQGTVAVFGTELPQVTYLFVLCGLFLLAVLAHGLLKMRINTLKGNLAERLLRRLRYTLIARTLRFPAIYFGRTSQGELVSMVTSESEPMGGLMGDAIAQPVLQAGQMLTIMGFLFAQNFIFGLAACALIPLQAWLIPKLQKKINLLNKKRVSQVRALATEIGEGAVGAVTLRLNGGWRYRLALVSDRLGKLYTIRLEIFQKKFFMKFLNNFIGQLTPFFFYSIGGFLAIKGEITIGALVAALAAYKDLSSPWKELLTYYNQHQDLSLRWTMITDRFAPAQMIDAALFEATDAEIPSLVGDIELSNVSVRSEDGHIVLDDVSVTFSAGQRIAISAPTAEERAALCAVLTREVLPSAGKVTIAGHALTDLHQTVVADRIGFATSWPVMFSGTFGENVLMPLLTQPQDNNAHTDALFESHRAGNSPDAIGANWLNLTTAGVASDAELRDWWLELIKGMGSEDALLRYGLDLQLNMGFDPAFDQDIVHLRPAIAKTISAAGLDDHIWPIDDTAYNPALTVIDNLLFATPRETLTVSLLAQHTEFLDLLTELKIEESLVQLSVEIVDMICQIFGNDGTNHPLFRRLNLDERDYETALALVETREQGTTFSSLQRAQLLIVPFSISAEVIGSSFPVEITERLLGIRRSHGKAFQVSMSDIFMPIAVDQPVAGLSILENALFGKITQTAGRNRDEINAIVANTLRSAGLEGQILNLVQDTQVGLGGKGLPVQIAEPLAVSRAAIKRPDVLILESVMSNQDVDARNRMYENLGLMMPSTTLICLEASLENSDSFDVHLSMQQGRIRDGEDVVQSRDGENLSANQTAKMRALMQSDMFNTLDPKQLRLLAFGSQWHHAKAGEYLFYKNDDPSSGAYLIFEGQADLLAPEEKGEDKIVLQVGPGDLVGELGLIRNDPRALDMRAQTELKSLRIGSDAFLAVVENDAATALKLLQVVAGYVGK